MIIDDQGGNGFRITELWAFVAIHDDGDESVIAGPIAGMMMPFIAADRTRVDQLRPHAVRIAKTLGRVGKQIKLVHFSDASVEEVIEP